MASICLFEMFLPSIGLLCREPGLTLAIDFHFTFEIHYSTDPTHVI